MREELIYSVDSVREIGRELAEIVGYWEKMERGENKGKWMIAGDNRDNFGKFVAYIEEKMSKGFEECLFVSSASRFYNLIIRNSLKFDLEYNTECGWSLAFGKIEGSLNARYVCASDGVVWNYWIILT